MRTVDAVFTLGYLKFTNQPLFNVNGESAFKFNMPDIHSLKEWECPNFGLKEPSDSMIRAKVWFKCAAMHDPVSPVIIKPCLVGWDAKHRKITLVIERSFSAEELIHRITGWVTIDPAKFIEVVKRHGRVTILNDRDLVVETETSEDYERLLQELKSIFDEEVGLEPLEQGTPPHPG